MPESPWDTASGLTLFTDLYGLTMAQAYDAADKAVDQAELALKALKQKRDFAEKKLVDQMVTEGIPSFRTDGFGGFRQEVCVYPRVTGAVTQRERAVSGQRFRRE